MNRDEILPDFMRREIEREIYAAEHPVGMSTHDGKAKIQATTLRRLMRLVAEIERLRADAERYRWLREKSSKKPDFYSGEPKWMVSREQGGMGQNFFGDGIDAAIDAAIAEERKP